MFRSFAGAMGLAIAASAAAARPHYIEVRLVSQSAVPKPGQTILLGFQMDPRPGWHGYWSNPGESGLAPGVKWSAPAGVRFGPLQHPAPTLLRSMGMTSYVHSGPHMLLARMKVDPKLRAGTVLPIAADLSWAACSEKLCVPQKARLTIRLTVGNGASGPQAVLIRRALARIPKRAAAGTFTTRGGELVLRLPASVHLQGTRARFFPDENGYWNAAHSRLLSARPLTLAGRLSGKPPTRISGVVSDGKSAYRILFEQRRAGR